MMNCLLKDETPNGKRVIMTRQMNIAEIENAIVGFIKLNEENGSSIARPAVKPKDNDTFLISFEYIIAKIGTSLVTQTVICL